MLDLVKVRMDIILADNGNLARLLLEKLKECNVTQAAVNGILSTKVIHPLLAHLTAVLEEELLGDAAESEEMLEMQEQLMEMDLAELKESLAQIKEEEPDVELPSGGKEEIVAWMVEWAKTTMEEEASYRQNHNPTFMVPTQFFFLFQFLVCYV